MKVSSDKYELPEIIADSADELAKKLGVNVNTIYSSISHARKRKSKRSMYQKVVIEKENDRDRK